MSFFKKLFGSSNDSQPIQHPKQTTNNTNVIRRPSFGRYTDMNKTKTQLEYWDKSIKEFKNKNYLESIKSFINYCGDTTEQNYTLSEHEGSISFEFIQGSKVLKGKANNNQVSIETRVAMMEKTSVPVMRKLMSINYGLTYSHFSLNDNVIYLKFSSHSIDASPNKLYAAIKELATKADQQDDLLVTEFSNIKEIDTSHIIKLSEHVIDVKYNYLNQSINHILNEINQLDQVKDNTGIAFLLLSLSYKIDYLIVPQGQLMHKLVRIQNIYFTKNTDSIQDKNNKIIREFNQILNTPKEEIIEGLYDVKSTFAIAPPFTHKQLMNFIYEQINKAQWYVDSGFSQVAHSIYEYAVSYSFFNFGILYPDAQLIDILMNILNPQYYIDMGINKNFINNGVLKPDNIKKEILTIINNGKNDYPFLKLDVQPLDFTSKISFANSLFKQMDVLDYRKQ